MAKIIVQSSEDHREFDLGPVTTIGRHPHNAVQILDRIVSKEHAQIIRQPDGQFLYRDLGSLNGSFMNDQRVSDRLLADGDVITLGGTVVIFQAQASPALQAAERVSIQQPAPSDDSAFIQKKVKASAEFLPRRKLATSKRCVPTTKSCAWPTSSGARLDSKSTSTACSKRSS
jgi:adenylate cyclase